MGRVPAEDAKIVAPEIAIGRRQCLVDEVRPDRVGEDLRQPEPEVEGARPALPDRTVLGRAVEDRVPVVDRLADVPRRGYGSTSRHDYREAGQHSATLRVTEKGRNRERDHDRREGPERERPNELSSAECNAERDRRQRPEVASDEHARGEQQRNRRQEHRQRLGMEHRRQPKGDRQEAEVAEGAGLEPRTPREELPRQKQEYDRSCHQHGPVHVLRKLVRILAVDVLAQKRGGTRERVEARRCVVLAARLGARDLPVMNQQVRIGLMLRDVEPPVARVVVRVPCGDQRERREQHCGDDVATAAQARTAGCGTD